jgi:hypothetical protein
VLFQFDDRAADRTGFVGEAISSGVIRRPEGA